MILRIHPVQLAIVRGGGAPISADTQLEGYRRFYTEDPFGNRVEILAENERPTTS
jgi:hypothetical protein